MAPIDSQELGQGEPTVIGYGYSVVTVYQMALWVCVRIKEHTVGAGRIEKQQLGFALLIQRREKWACFSPSPVVHGMSAVSGVGPAGRGNSLAGQVGGAGGWEAKAD